MEVRIGTANINSPQYFAAASPFTAWSGYKITYGLYGDWATLPSEYFSRKVPKVGEGWDFF